MKRGYIVEPATVSAVAASWLGQHIDLINAVVALLTGLIGLAIMVARAHICVRRKLRRRAIRARRMMGGAD